jgi:hypothetical protein
MTAIPIGNIIAAVAVFEIHMDTKAVATTKPKRRRLGSPPIARMMVSAILRWRFHSSMAAAMQMPPRKRKM